MCFDLPEEVTLMWDPMVNLWKKVFVCYNYRNKG